MHLKYLAAQILGIVLVVLFFRWIPERRVAALMAASVFVILPVWISLLEQKRTAVFKLTRVGAVIFFISCALPILFMRLIFWDQEFKDIQVLGIRAATLHGASNSVYLAWMLFTVIDGLREWKIKRGS